MKDPVAVPASRIAALIVAAGSGERAGAGVPKQYRLLAGEPVLRRSVRVFLEHPQVDLVLCVTRPGDEELFRRSVEGLSGRRLAEPVGGGHTRQASVLAGLESLARLDPTGPAIVLVHDAARPFARHDLVDRAIAAAREHGAAVPAVAVVDTVKRVDETGRIVDTPPRAALRAVQTPQAFSFPLLLDAHRRAAAADRTGLTDDAAVMEWAGHPAYVFPGDPANVKLTTAADFEDAERAMTPPLETRVGCGYDVHAFDPARPGPVWLGGIAVPHDIGVKAHSDGDVVLHALTDALLGALADGDIGVHFPPSDPQWRDVSSDRFVRFAVDRVRARGGRIAHVDVTLVCEAPRIGPHREAMCMRIAGLCGIDVGRVGLKATTSEGLGFTGRREGLAAQVVATVRLPAGEDA